MITIISSRIQFQSEKQVESSPWMNFSEQNAENLNILTVYAQYFI